MNIFKSNPEQAQTRTIVERGTDKKTGRKAVKYSDGTTEYAD